MMNWQQLLSTTRDHRSSEERLSLPNEIGRTQFHKDHDRIVFSNSFRRLNRKTQVHPLSENDHIHSRLTHSLEVSCVGRSLGARVATALQHQLPDVIGAFDIAALVEAACLAHDIGNPPYGHTGEDAIRHWFLDSKNQDLLEGLADAQVLDLQNYEGNAQGFRIVTQVEYHRFTGGMRLTHATLGTFLKYPWTSKHLGEPGTKADKFGCFQSELPILQRVAEDLGLIQLGSERWARHPLVYLMEMADDICYGLIDLEDGIEMGILQYSEVEAILKPLLADDWHYYEADFDKADNLRRRLSMLRGKAMEKLVAAASQAFVENESSLLAGTLTGDLNEHCDPVVSDCILSAKALARDRIFKDPRKTAIEVGAYSTLATLLRLFLEAAKEVVVEGKPRYRNSRVLEIMGPSAPKHGWDLYSAYMRVLDFIVGMTDSYAAEVASQFSGYSPR